MKDDFNELLERVRRGRELSHASFEPVYYLVFAPKLILDVKRQLPAWEARLRNEGWEVHTFSIAEAVLDIVRSAPLRKLWLRADSRQPLAWEKANASIANRLEQEKDIERRLAAKLEELKDANNGILLVTDLEALHPYMRIGAIEGALSEKFYVPTVFFYPGKRAGKSTLSFLGFYPDDGNYRSCHVGG
tara:strand:- start:1712 stop:2278 length:567 start_codon:yes stop_codon:yes gene_type:complete